MRSFDGLLGGPWPLTITSMYHNGTPQSFSQSITAATRTNGAYFTSTGISLDQYYNINFGTGPGRGPTVSISGGTGNWAAANGTWTATVASGDANGFTIPAINSSSWGAVTGSLTVTTAPPLINSVVASVTNTSPPVVTTTNSIGNEVANHRLLNGDSIVFSNYPATNYYAKVTGTTTFQVYTEPGPDRPSGLFGHFRRPRRDRFLRRTMSVGTAGLSDFGYTLRPYRCGGSALYYRQRRWRAVRPLGSAAEHAAYPCSSNPSNTSLAQLQTMQLGTPSKI